MLDVTRAQQVTKGAGATVAVLDTGVDSDHPDLTGQVTGGPDFSGSTTEPGEPGWGKHGTSMASLIAGHGHGPGGSSGIMGVAPEAQILSVRVITDSADPDHERLQDDPDARAAVTKGIRWAVDHGADVINMSIGDEETFGTGIPVERQAINYALKHDVVVVASAGNTAQEPGPDDDDLNEASYPAAYPGVIAVSAVNRAGEHASFSTYQQYVTVAAPGVNIASATAGGGYVLGQGTSPASALVSGIAALITSAYPKLPAPMVKQALIQGTVDQPASGHNEYVGFGVVNAAKALRRAAELAAPARTAQPTPVPSHFGGGPGRSGVGSAAPVAVLLYGLLGAGSVALIAVGGYLLVLHRQPSGAAARQPTSTGPGSPRRPHPPPPDGPTPGGHPAGEPPPEAFDPMRWPNHPPPPPPLR